MSPTSSPRQPGAGVARHAAFKVHRDSHSIHKATSPLSSGSGSTNSSGSSSSNNAIITSSSQPPRRQQQQQQQPVIIYTHSPKVIRTSPRDFMSIVQRLTGLDSHGRGAPPAEGRGHSGSVVAAAPQDESSSSSSDSCANNTHAAGLPPYADSQLMPPPPPPAPPLDGHFMAHDIPLLFAHDAAASDLQQFCTPRGFYGQFPPVDAAAGIGPVTSTNMHEQRRRQRWGRVLPVDGGDRENVFGL